MKPWRTIFLANKNPIGKHIGTETAPGSKPDMEIVGVVKDAKYVNVREKTRRHFYVPLAQIPRLMDLTLHVKTSSDPAGTMTLIRDQVQQVDPNLPLYDMKTLALQIDESLTQDRLIGWLTSLFGLLATFLAAIGLYGVVAFSVMRRTREIGIRMALGAERPAVLRLVLRHILVLVAVGTAAGFALSLWLGKLLQSMLYELKPVDPFTFLAAGAVLLSAAAMAAYIPAWRATRIDPMVALRYE